jgi:LPXTG-site transpeptidase (sortase) family protein
MRHHIVSSRPRLARLKVMVMAAMFATITIGATACSGQSGAPVAPSPRAAPLTRSTPVRLQIATIGVDSTLMKLGLGADGSMNVPSGGFPAGWYTGGPTPGEKGPAVIAGHVDMKGPGVFYKLHSVKPGDQIMVTRADGSKPVFRVTQVQQYQKDSFPTKLVYGNLDHAGLRLITCGGTFNKKSGHYEDDLVVFADLMAPTP